MKRLLNLVLTTFILTISLQVQADIHDNQKLLRSMLKRTSEIDRLISTANKNLADLLPIASEAHKIEYSSKAAAWIAGTALFIVIPYASGSFVTVGGPVTVGNALTYTGTAVAMGSVGGLLHLTMDNIHVKNKESVYSEVYQGVLEEFRHAQEMLLQNVEAELESNERKSNRFGKQDSRRIELMIDLEIGKKMLYESEKEHIKGFISDLRHIINS